MSIEIVGPFVGERRLVVDGWQVPFIDCYERDNGRVEFVIDKRLGFEVGPGDFEQVARLVANAYALGIGLASFPNDEWFPDGMPEEKVYRAALFAGIPQPMRPIKCTGIELAKTEGAA